MLKRTAERTNRIGRHLPTSGGLTKTLQRAEGLGCETLQVFVSNPQGWADPVTRPDAAAFAAGAREQGISPVVVHAKYLINLASPNAEHRDRSVRTLVREQAAAGELGADLIVVHSGSHGGAGQEEGLSRLVSSLKRVRELSGSNGRAPELAVENSVGAGTQLCSTFEALEEVSRRAGVGVCVDTAHAFVAGYDLSAPEGAREVVEKLREVLGGRISLLHLNDARNGLGSHRDGHRRIGEGQVAEESWTEIFAGLPGVPVVMETLYGTPEVDLEQVQLAKQLAARPPSGCQTRRDEYRI